MRAVRISDGPGRGVHALLQVAGALNVRNRVGASLPSVSMESANTLDVKARR